jgi:hypothetical protein
MAVGKRKRQNFRLDTLPDEDRAVFVEVRHGTIPSRQLVAIVALPRTRFNRHGCDGISSIWRSPNVRDHGACRIVSGDHNVFIHTLARAFIVQSNDGHAMP